MQHALLIIDVQSPTRTALVDQPRSAADDLPRKMERLLFIDRALCQRDDHLVVHRVIRRTPLLIGNQVTLLRQVVRLIEDRRSAVASDLHRSSARSKCWADHALPAIHAFSKSSTQTTPA